MRVFEVSILTPVVLIFIGFSCIPTVFYGITSQEDEVNKLTVITFLELDMKKLVVIWVNYS